LGQQLTIPETTSYCFLIFSLNALYIFHNGNDIINFYFSLKSVGFNSTIGQDFVVN